MNENVDFELKKIGNTSIFKLNEKKFDASIAGFVKGEITILLHSENVDNLIFDLSEISYCDSSGLSAILLAYRILQSNEGHIRLAAPTKNVKMLIEISQLNRILPIFDTVEAAVEDLKNLSD